MTKLMPGVKIEFSDTDTRQVLDALANDKADIGIASGYHALNGTLATVLYEDQFGLVGAANHPLLTQSQAPSTAEVVTSAFIRNNLCESITNPAFTEALKHVKVTIRNNHSLINTISNSHWVSVLPESVIEHLPGSVAFRPISDLQDKREVWLYHRERSHFKDAVETCVRIIVDLDLGKKRTLRSAKAPVFE
jgi:DNA-binding transcriptional LysR family regulator